MLTQNQIDEFDENGCLVIKSFYDMEKEIEPIQYDLYRIIGALIEREGLSVDRKAFSPESFDSGFMELIAYNRNLGGVVYDAAKQIPAFVRLLSSEKHEAVYRLLYGCEFPGIGHGGQGIRIDIPFEEKFRAPWHQEYLNQLRSMEGLIFWSPLLRVTQNMGPVEFCLGSHKSGVFPVRMFDLNNPTKKGAYAMVIDREDEIISSYPQAAPLLEPGDVVLAHWLVLHRSGFNSSDRCRWSMQMRHFSFDNETAITNSWVGSFASGIKVETIHPELVIKEKDS
jgi:hypothetical protein